jgi:hypothetical protein
MPIRGPSGAADPANPEGGTLPYEIDEFIGTETDPETPIVLAGVDSTGTAEAITYYAYYIINVQMLGITAPPDFSAVITQPKTVTIRSEFPDMFDRLIKYLKYSEDNTDITNNYNVKTYGTVPRFADLPPQYTAVYEYISPPAGSKSVTIRVNHYQYSEVGGSATPATPPWGNSNPIGNATYNQYITFSDWTFTINENFTLVNQYFLSSVANGTAGIKAKTVYPELN